MKAVLVIDLPTTCEECQFCGRGGVNLERYVCCLTGEHSEDSHLVGCPLRPLPQRERADDEGYGLIGMVDTAWTQGFNACLAEIIGATE